MVIGCLFLFRIEHFKQNLNWLDEAMTMMTMMLIRWPHGATITHLER